MTHSTETQTAASSPRAFAYCPSPMPDGTVCGQPAISDATRLVRGVYLANYSCGAHMWDTRWLASELPTDRRGGLSLQERFDHLVDLYGSLLAVHARVQMDNPEDKALHAKAVEVFTQGLRQVR